MARSSKLVASKRGRVLLVRRRRDKLCMSPGGRRRGHETAEQCLWREIKAPLCGVAGFRQARGGELLCVFVCNVVFATCWRIPNKCGFGFRKRKHAPRFVLRPAARAAVRAREH